MTLRRTARPNRRGLSLLEVVLALAILVIATAAIGQLVDIGTDRGTEARVYSRGARLAQSKMAEAEAGLVSLNGDTDGQFDGDDAAWNFKVSSAAAGPTNLHTVTVTVSRDVRGRPLQVTLTQMIFDPTMVGSSAQAEIPPDSSLLTPGASTITGATLATGTGGSP